MEGIERIAAERKRQVEEEGYTTEHDDEHTDGSLAEAAASYCLATSSGVNRCALAHDLWPWHDGEFNTMASVTKRRDRVRDLTKAGALIAAEIDRLLRRGTTSTGQRDEPPFVEAIMLPEGGR